MHLHDRLPRPECALLADKAHILMLNMHPLVIEHGAADEMVFVLRLFMYTARKEKIAAQTTEIIITLVTRNLTILFRTLVLLFSPVPARLFDLFDLGIGGLAFLHGYIIKAVSPASGPFHGIKRMVRRLEQFVILQPHGLGPGNPHTEGHGKILVGPQQGMVNPVHGCLARHDVSVFGFAAVCSLWFPVSFVMVSAYSSQL